MARSSRTLWSAKARFGGLIRAARRQPQVVTWRGRPAVVVLSAAEYARLRHLEQTRTPTFIEHLLAIPQDGEKFERLNVRPREVEF